MGRKELLCLVVLLAAGTWIAGTSEVAPRSSKPEIQEREDLSEEETGSDYAKQFGTVRAFPQFAHPQRFYGHSWVPYQPVDHHGYSAAPVDPFVLRVLERYLKYLAPGLGPYGFYGGPKAKPPGVFHFVDKDK